MSDIVIKGSSSSDDEIEVVVDQDLSGIKADCTTAKVAAELAQANAETAETNAETAQGLAETARDASIVAQSASESARDLSSTYASNSSSSASSASISASTATTQAGIATTKASEASGYASNANTSATNAGISATSASNSATEASGYAVEAQEARDDAQVSRIATNETYAAFRQGFAGKFLYVNLPTDVPAGTLAYDLTNELLVSFTGVYWAGASRGDSITDVISNKVGATTTVEIYIENQLAHTFQILDGEKGDKGDTGEQGIQGIQGIQGVKGDTGDDITAVTSSKVGGTTTVKTYIEGVLSNTYTVEDGQEAYTDAEIKTKYESNADTNAYTDAEKTKLAGIEALAEVNEVTLAGVETLTNKTLSDYTNTIHADAVHIRVKCVEASGIPKGKAVSFSGYNSGENAIEVVLGNNATGVGIGITEENISNGGFGNIVMNGIIDGLDTSAYTAGQILYLNGTGDLTATEPSSGFAQPIAFVLRNHTTVGAIQVNASYPKQDASDVRNTASGNLTATTVQGALNELQSELDSLTTDTEW